MFKKGYDTKITGSEFEPWITRDAISLLENLLKPEFIGLEWGCGSSSIWYLEKIGFLYTIEHDLKWKNKVEWYLNSNRKHLLKKWNVQHIKEDALKDDILYADCNNISRKEYCSATSVPDDLDFICVDGRSRRGCISTAVKKLKKEEGILMLDNSDRNEYYPNAIPSQWKKIDTSNGIWETAIWISKSEK